MGWIRDGRSQAQIDEGDGKSKARAWSEQLQVLSEPNRAQIRKEKRRTYQASGAEIEQARNGRLVADEDELPVYTPEEVGKHGRDSAAICEAAVRFFHDASTKWRMSFFGV